MPPSLDVTVIPIGRRDHLAYDTQSNGKTFIYFKICVCVQA